MPGNRAFQELLPQLIFTTTPEGKTSYLHLIAAATETQRGEVTCSGSQTKEVIQLGGFRTTVWS